MKPPALPGVISLDVFLKIYSNLASFDTSRGSLQVWITTMTRNLLVDNFRRTRNQRATGSLDDGWDTAEELKPLDRLTAHGPSPHELGGPEGTCGDGPECPGARIS
jgi:RNA polymerase sigma-70 factor (ECF subfamily)